MSQISLTFPDGNKREFSAGVTPAEVAASISTSLAKKAISATVNGKHWDLQWPIAQDASIAIHTLQDDAQALELIRHDLAHIMARAVQEIWPDVKVTIGPVRDQGWFYDFDRAEPFTPEDLGAIEARMKQIINARELVKTELWERARAVEYYRGRGEPFKLELLDRIPEGEDIRMYWHGAWQDLCRGPHLQHTGQVPADAFKLTHVAGAYWLGDASRPMLQRIYGVAFKNRDDLKAHLTMLEEAAKRDHRKLGREMDLFHLQEEAPGMVFWHPNGWTLWQQIEQYMRRVLTEAGYQEVKTPLVMDRQLWERSGHWDNYRDNMFTTESEKRDYAVKPMNCPGHVQIYNHGLHSYRDLPLRLAEFGSCHRNEPSGALHGLMRVRGFVQDDAHIFCTEDQIVAEVTAFNELLSRVYRDFGFTDVAVKLSLRPEKRAGSDEVWDKAEGGLREALAASGHQWEELPGEGAFYGPKIEYHVKDALGRSWQCGTMQLDFVLPERLDAEYVAEDNTRRRPVMLHRAILGSLERFIGILIENHAGALPMWLSPVQAVVLNISEAQADYVAEVVKTLRSRGFRVEADLRNEKITYKIREHSVRKLPYLLVVGDKEKAADVVAVRARGNQDLGQMSLEEVVERWQREISTFAGTA